MAQSVHLLQPSQGCWSVPGHRDGRQVHGFVVKYGFDSNVYVGSSLVDMNARCSLMDEAQFVFDSLLSKNDVSYNALIAGHAGRMRESTRF